MGEGSKVDKALRRARGAVSNATGRYEGHDRVAFDDGWDIPEERPGIRTEFQIDATRSILAKNSSPDIPFDRSINPYRGCEHGCIYCFARPSHAFLGLSPGLDFETRIFVKPRAAALLRKELSRPSYNPAVVAMGTNTDPYQPGEKTYRVMREVLEVLREFQHPISIVTKGGLIRRDLDILGPMGHEGLASVGVSLTTMDKDLCRAMEPRAAAPGTRLRMIEALSGAGVPVRVMVSPVIPGLTDHEMEGLLAAGRDAGAVAASYILLRLPLEVAPLFREWLEEARPGHAAKVMARLREMRGGKDYDAEWGRRMTGEGLMADLIAERFGKAIRRLGLRREMAPLRCDLFRVPGRAEQMELF